MLKKVTSAVLHQCKMRSDVIMAVTVQITVYHKVIPHSQQTAPVCWRNLMPLSSV